MYDDYAIEAAAVALAGGADSGQSDDMGMSTDLEEFSPRIAKLMTSRRQVGQAGRAGRRARGGRQERLDGPRRAARMAGQWEDLSPKP